MLSIFGTCDWMLHGNAPTMKSVLLTCNKLGILMFSGWWRRNRWGGSSSDWVSYYPWPFIGDVCTTEGNFCKYHNLDVILPLGSRAEFVFVNSHVVSEKICTFYRKMAVCI